MSKVFTLLFFIGVASGVLFFAGWLVFLVSVVISIL
jgi:hypothetical protein